MTGDAKAHLEIFVLKSVLGFHRPVAFLTGHFFFDMSLVIEKDMFRQVVDLDPGCGGSRVKIFVLLFDLGMIGDDVLMTIEALLHGGYTRKSRPTHVRMTKRTLDLFDARVETMAEGYGLCRPKIGARVKVEIVEKTHQEDQAAKNKKKGTLVAFRP
jgi:hypothetical protein